MSAPMINFSKVDDTNHSSSISVGRKIRYKNWQALKRVPVRKKSRGVRYRYRYRGEFFYTRDRPSSVLSARVVAISKSLWERIIRCLTQWPGYYIQPNACLVLCYCFFFISIPLLVACRSCYTAKMIIFGCSRRLYIFLAIFDFSFCFFNNIGMIFTLDGKYEICLSSFLTIFNKLYSLSVSFNFIIYELKLYFLITVNYCRWNG